AHQTVDRTRRISLIEDEGDDGEHRSKTAREVRLIWDPIRNARVANLALGAGRPLCHGRLGYQEGPRDLGGRETAEKPQRERDLNVAGQCRMTAGKNQSEALVAHGALLGLFVARV